MGVKKVVKKAAKITGKMISNLDPLKHGLAGPAGQHYDKKIRAALKKRAAKKAAKKGK